MRARFLPHLLWFLIAGVAFGGGEIICPDQLRQRILRGEFAAKSQYAEIYDALVELYAPHHQLRKMHAKVQPRGKVTILDAGGGSGIVAFHVKRDDPERSVEIFDDSKFMTDVAVKKGFDPKKIHNSNIIRFVRNDGTLVPDGSVDGIISNHVLYLLTAEEIAQFFAECWRVLRPGGVLSIASVRTLDREAMLKFLETAKAAGLRMEELELIPKGSTDVGYSTNVRLTDHPPSTFLNEEIIATGKANRFVPIEGENYVVYDGAAFFVAFRKGE